MKSKTYEDFIEKFKEKKTTDDCYTPEPVYHAIRNWVCSEYDIKSEKFVRPFFPGGDYENFNYSDDCVVVDNPPFSKLAKIMDFYVKHNIRFFLFAPSTTIFSAYNKSYCYICIGISVEFDNGAKVPISFITNLEHGGVRTAPDLYEILQNVINKDKQQKKLPKYTYPPNVLIFSYINNLSRYGVDFKINAEELAYNRGLDNQKEYGKSFFGAAFLMSDKATSELIVAQHLAEKNKQTHHNNLMTWKLSDRELEIVKKLNT